MKTSKELHALTLCCLAALFFAVFQVLGRPRTPPPPLPTFAPLLSRFDFDETYWQGTNTPLVETEYGQLIESWSGYALVRSGPMLKPFVAAAIEGGCTNLALESGAVRFWFKPYWTSSSLPNGAGPGTEATLLDLVVLGDNDIISAWSLRFSADGTALILGEGETEVLRADAAWPAGEWHCLALNYGPEETALFLDGVLVAKARASRFPCFIAERDALWHHAREPDKARSLFYGGCLGNCRSIGERGPGDCPKRAGHRVADQWPGCPF